MGDDFSRRDASYDTTWPKPQTPRLLKRKTQDVTPTTDQQTSVTTWDQAATDSTNMDMLEHRLIQPGDL